MFDRRIQSEIDAAVMPQLEQACEELERRLRAGQPCSAESLLRRFPTLASHRNVALELIYTEFVVRKELGQSPTPRVWIDQFPQWRADLCELFQVHELLGDEIKQASDNGRAKSLPDGNLSLPDLCGRRIGQYEILEELARGGMGVVYKARQASLNRLVALKMILTPHAGPRECARLRTEADATARLQHPNIVPIYEVGEHDGCPYLSMEFVDGTGLDRKIAGVPLAARAAAELLEVLAHAVHFAHQAGIIHRDLKPANVLLTRDGMPKITDFGLAMQHLASDGADTAERSNGLTHAGAILGTPSYMAPEQASAGTESVGPAVDVYALGSILYEGLTGRAPFRGESPLHTVELLRTQEPVPPSRLQPKVPRDLETICLKCLEKDPRRRYHSASDLAADLRRFLENRPILARPASAWERVTKWSRRRPAAAALCVAVVLGFLGISWQWLRAESQRASAEISRTQAVLAANRAEEARRAESEQRDRLERSLYFHDIALAHHEYLTHNTQRAVDLLDACRSDLRGWEWHYLNRLFRQEVLSLAHNQRVLGLTFSPDGSHLVACTGLWGANEPGEIRVWNAATGQEIWALHGHAGPVMCLDISPDGKLLASTGVSWERGNPDRVKIWDIATGNEVLSFEPPENVFSLAFNREGLLALGSTNGMIRIWNLATNEQVSGLPGHKDCVFGLSYSSDGRRLASGSRDGTVRLWDVSECRELSAASNLGDVRTVMFSPDNQRVAAGTFAGSLVIFDATGEELRSLSRHRRTPGLSSVRFSPDGQLLALGTRGEGVKIWDAETGDELRAFYGHLGYVNEVAFSPDGRRLASGGIGGQIRVWDLTNDPPMLEIARGRLDAAVSSIAYSPDGQTLAIAQAFRNETRGRNPDGATLRVRAMDTGRTVLLHGHTDSLTSVVFSPDGQYVATGSRDCTARLWELKNATSVQTLKGHAGDVTNLAFSPDGRRLATASADCSMKVWDPTTGEELYTIHGHELPVQAIAYSNDGRYLVSGGADCTVRIWDGATGDKVATWGAPSSPITSLACSHDGQFVATSGEDGLVHLWDFGRPPSDNAPTPIRTMRGHSARVSSVTFSPDSRRVVSVGLDFVVRVWDVATGQEATTFVHPTSNNSVAVFHPEGKQLALSYGSMVQVWDAHDELAGQHAQDSQHAVLWHRREIQRTTRDNKWFAAAFHLGQLIHLKPPYWQRYASRALVQLELGELTRAAEDFETAAELTNDYMFWCRSARCYLAANQLDHYRQICEQLVEKYAGVPHAANPIVWTCALSEHSIDPEKLIGLAEKAVSESRDSNSLNGLGAALCRAGRNDEAIAQVNRSVEAHGDGGTPLHWLFLGLAYERMGRPDESRDWLLRVTQAGEPAKQPSERESDPYAAWDQRIVLKILRHEAETSLTGIR
jgi:WD40 repeat protein/serine/threonine protein kinase